MIDDKNTDAVEEAAEEAVEAAPAPSLTVQDLANLRNIIDVASQRGAFKPNEFSVVGESYNKLNEFILSVTPAPAEEAPAEEASEEGE